MVALERRAEVLFEDKEYEALRREARRRGMSFGELIRDAARRQYLQPSEERRRRAIQWLTSGPEVDVGTWEDAKKLIGRWTDAEIKTLP